METNGKLFIEKETLRNIKGTAIIMMIIHHVLTIPNWWPSYFKASDMLIWFARHFNVPTKLCVYIFAFITGYYYFYSKNKGSYKYSLLKITKLLINYWLVLLVGFVLTCFISKTEINLLMFIKEMFGLTNNILCFSWYVPFYCISILLLPLIYKVLSYSKTTCLFCFIFPIIIGKLLKFFIPDDAILYTLISDLRIYFPCMVFGFSASRYNLFEDFDNTINSIVSKNILEALYI